jgi:2-oxoglutarate ferredoxin oxidoreductase subunit gamma
MNLTRLDRSACRRLLASLECVARQLGPAEQPVVLSSLPEMLKDVAQAPFGFVHGPAGRNIALAVGLRAACPRTPLILVMNADGVTLGTNHLIHAARRNVGMTLLLLRSELTASDESLDRTSWELPDYQREMEAPSRPLEWVTALDAALVGRANLDDTPSVTELVMRAVRTPGFSVIGITTERSLQTGVLSQCEWPEYFESYRSWARPLREAPAAIPAAPAPARSPSRHVPRLEVRIAGLGGHGVKLAGTVLSEAAGFHEGLWATQRGDYGSATRGGPSSVDVVLGSDPISYPSADHPDALVVLSQAACDRHAPSVKRGGRVVVDPAEVSNPPRDAIVVPITAIAREHTGKPIAAGVVALGCIAALTDAVSRESLERSLATHVPRALPQNISACMAGYAATRAALGG